jgi:UDP-glucose 4-epimerase
MNRLNVLITGASNPIGERLIRIMLADSRVNRILAVSGADPKTLPLPSETRLQRIQVDLQRTRRVRQLLFGPARDMAIDVVVHLALHRSAHDSGTGVHSYNVEALRSIVQLSERHPSIRRLVIRSSAAVYQMQRDLPNHIEEDHPLNLHGNAPQWIRDRVEADVTACARMGMTPLKIAVLRMTEALAPGTGSQLYDYLESPVCLRPAGFDPMVNLLTIDDSALALQKAALSDAQGIFNIPGADTLPLSACIRSWGRLALPFPDQLMSPLYRMRYRLTGHDFRYGMNRRRFLYSGVLDGERARKILGYVPCHPIVWPTS